MSDGTAQAGTTIPGYVSGTWTIDPAHSNVGFAVRHMMVGKVRGRFSRFTGQVVTASRLSESSVTAEIEMASVERGQSNATTTSVHRTSSRWRSTRP